MAIEDDIRARAVNKCELCEGEENLSIHMLSSAEANGLDAAQAAGGWKSRETVEKTYTDAPSELNKKAVDHIGNMITGSLALDGSNQEICTSSKVLRLVQDDNLES